MTKVPQLILDVRYVGESIVSISQDVQLLLPGDYNDDVNVMKKAKHAKGLVEDIISVLTFLNTLDFKSLDKQKELSDDVRKIEFSCFGLQSLLSQALINPIIFQTYEKEINKFIKVVNTSAKRLITISFIAKHQISDSGNDERFKDTSCTEEPIASDYDSLNEIDIISKSEVCFKDKATCELDCDGFCYNNDYSNDKEMQTSPKTGDKFEDVSNNDVSSNEVGSVGGGDVCYKNRETCELDCDGICYMDDCNKDKEMPNIPESIDIFKDKRNYDETLNEVSTIGSGDVCYKDREACEFDCDGICYEDKTDEELPKCPEYSETFTESTLTLMESGYDELEQAYWRKQTKEKHNENEQPIIDVVSGQEKSNTAENNILFYKYINAEIKKAIDTLVEEYENITERNSDFATSINDEYLNSVVEDATLTFKNIVIDKVENSDSSDYFNNIALKDNYTDLDRFDVNDAIKSNDHKVNILNGEHNTIDTYGHSIKDFEESYDSDHQITIDEVNNYSSDAPITDYEASNNNDANEVKTSDYGSTTEATYTENYESTIETPTTVSYYDTNDATTSIYETSPDNTETTTYSYDTFTTTETTTPAYETTTEDLYKVSQDIYSAAQDLSTKANEISSIASDMSSKISNINSMVSDLNSYDDDELSKKVQSVSKITQELSSKTSEISSLCSTTSSLASDISSASSDMPSADRNHRFKTSPWQKMSAKCQEMVTACQSIVTSAQDILIKMDSIVSTTSDLKVAEAVSAGAYEVTAKTQLVISETLNIVSAVIELMSVIES